MYKYSILLFYTNIINIEFVFKKIELNSGL